MRRNVYSPTASLAQPEQSLGRPLDRLDLARLFVCWTTLAISKNYNLFKIIYYV